MGQHEDVSSLLNDEPPNSSTMLVLQGELGGLHWRCFKVKKISKNTFVKEI
jgi:hypothetical protein